MAYFGTSLYNWATPRCPPVKIPASRPAGRKFVAKTAAEYGNLPVLTSASNDNNPSLFDLPLEVRRMIYTFLLAGAQIELEPTPESGHGYQLYRNTSIFRTICLTSHILYLEVSPIFKRALTEVTIHPNFCTNCNVLCKKARCIPECWRENIRIVHCTDLASLTFSTYDFPNLKAIEIPSRFFHVAEKKKPSDEVAPSEILAVAASQEALWRCPSILVTRRGQYLNKFYSCGIKVLVRVLYANYLRDQSTGWEAYIDLKEWTIQSINKVLMRKTPYPKRLDRHMAKIPLTKRGALQQERFEWRRNPANWTVLRYDEMNLPEAPVS